MAAAEEQNREIPTLLLAAAETQNTEIPTLIFEKELKHSDVSKRQSRFVIPAEQAREIVARLGDSVRAGLQQNPERGITIEFRELLLHQNEQNTEPEHIWPWLFKQWKSSGSFVLIHGWIDFVLLRNLQCDSKARFCTSNSCSSSSSSSSSPQHTFYISVVHGEGQGQGSSSSMNRSIVEMQKEKKHHHHHGVAKAKAKKREMLSRELAASAAPAKRKKMKMIFHVRLCLCLWLRLRMGRADGDPMLCSTCAGLL